MPRRDLSWSFESRILVDDNVLVEPLVGLRPWVASEVYELGVKTLLGEAAVNREKDLIEGPFRTFQTVWGLDMDTATEEIHLPERRILKGAHLLNDGAFEYGCKDLTVRTVQRFGVSPPGGQSSCGASRMNSKPRIGFYAEGATAVPKSARS